MVFREKVMFNAEWIYSGKITARGVERSLDIERHRSESYIDSKFHLPSRLTTVGCFLPHRPEGRHNH